MSCGDIGEGLELIDLTEPKGCKGDLMERLSRALERGGGVMVILREEDAPIGAIKLLAEKRGLRFTLLSRDGGRLRILLSKGA